MHDLSICNHSTLFYMYKAVFTNYLSLLLFNITTHFHPNPQKPLRCTSPSRLLQILYLLSPRTHHHQTHNRQHSHGQLLPRRSRHLLRSNLLPQRQLLLKHPIIFRHLRTEPRRSLPMATQYHSWRMHFQYWDCGFVGFCAWCD